MADAILKDLYDEGEYTHPLIRTLRIMQEQQREIEKEKCFFDDHKLRKKPINKISYL